MAGKLIYFWVLIIVSSSPVLSHVNQFVFNGFKDAGNSIALNGISEIEHNGILRLTDESSRFFGRAFYPNAVRLRDSNGRAVSFSTAFALAIVPEYKKLGGHGMAFTIAPSKELPGAQPSQFLGLLSAGDNGNSSNHVFAVEFDTVQDFEFNDINDNHVGVDINSMVSNVSTAVGYYVDGNFTKQNLSLQTGKTIQVWIDYDSSRNELNVTLSPISNKPARPIISYPVDLSPYFRDSMFVGFSASTGLLASSHYLFGWSFNLSGPAQSLDLSSLPSLPGPKKSQTPMVVGVSASAVAVLIIAIATVIYVIFKIKNMDVIEDWEFTVGPHRFSYKELKKATKGFREKELLGFGGFGRVYKGTLPNSNAQVAVKRISHESKQGLREFVSEIASIGRLRHRNLVQLLGWCRRRGDLLLVYDFMPNGSLDKFLFDEPKTVLSWEQRFKIIRGVASGLLYLHEEWEQTVIHRDIKAGNVLLDSEMNGRLGDFGLAKLYEHGSNPSTTRVVGTLGYLAPELTRTGKPTTSSDVFAFGALLLEVVCGRRPIEPKALPEELILVEWVWDKWKEGAILEVLDQRLGGEFDEIEAVVVLKLGLLCSNDAVEKRPTMRQVVMFLEGEVGLPEQLTPPDNNDGKKHGSGAAASGGGGEFEDFVHSYPPSSYFEKVSAWSTVEDAEGALDVEAGSASPFSVPGRGDVR